MSKETNSIITAHQKAVAHSSIELEAQHSTQSFKIDMLPKEVGSGFIDIYDFDRVIISRANVIFSQPQEMVQPNDIEYLGFSIVLNGEVTMDYENIDMSINSRSHQVWWRQGNLGQVNVRVPAHQKISILSIDFKKDLLEKLIDKDLLMPRLRLLYQQLSPCCTLLDNVPLKTIYKAYELLNFPCAESDIDLIQLEGRTLSVLGELLQSRTADISGYNQDAIDIAGMILSTECSQKITTRQLARRIGLNEFTLKQEFKVKYGMTIGQFILKNRMALAVDLLSSGCDINQVIKQTGYCDKYYFAKVFTNYFGYSP